MSATNHSLLARALAGTHETKRRPKKRKLPRWMRRQVACPECGYILKHLEEGWKFDYDPVRWEPINQRWDCPNYKAHFTHGDFWDEQREKWSRQA